MKKILVTGATGFVGSHLLDYLISRGEKNIYGSYFSESSIQNLGENKEKVKLFKIDLTNEEETKKLIEDVKPDDIYHLAAFTSPADSFASPRETVLNNIACQINILEAMKKGNLKNTKILVISSAEVYGKVGREDLPVDEKTDFNPINPYAVSKLTQDFLGRQYFLAFGLKVIRVRPFNHIGPRQSPDFVVSAFAKKIVEIEKGKRNPTMPVGNLEAKRDFTNVRDMVKAYDLILEKGVVGDVYNIGSGKSIKISEILEKLIALSKVKVSIELDKSLLRPIDNPDLVCDPTKISKLTGWKAQVPLEETLKEVLNYWRDQI